MSHKVRTNSPTTYIVEKEDLGALSPEELVLLQEDKKATLAKEWLRRR